MICPSCSECVPDDSDACHSCGESLRARVPSDKKIPSNASAHIPSDELKTKEATPVNGATGLVPLLRNMTRIATFFVTNIILFGAAGAFSGIIASLAFRRYLVGYFPDARISVYIAFAIIYFFLGGAALWGYIGFLKGATRAMEFLIVEKNVLSTAVSNIVGSVMGYIERNFIKNTNPKSNETDIDNIAIPYKTLAKAFTQVNSDEYTSTSVEDRTLPKQNRGIRKLIVWFLMNGRLTKPILLLFSQSYKTKKGVTFAELRENISVLANSVGNIILEDLYMKRMVFTFILIPAHLLLPFAAVYLYWRVKY